MNWTDTDLCRIALKYHTDKAHSHNYTPTYHKLLAGKTVKKVLEIGLGWGGLMHNDYPPAGSLLMWRDYFPEAEIYGLDIRPDTLRNEGRIHSFLCDQDNLDSLLDAADKVGRDFDLIVDDGSHVPMHQVTTALVFVPLLAPGGIYVIEDVHKEFFKPGPEHNHVPSGDITELDYVRQNLGFKHEVIEIENDELPDDRLIVIREQDRCTVGPSRCVVNAVFESSFYKHGQKRLAKELLRWDPWARQMFWQKLPANWPDPRKKPYSFKAFALHEAAKTCDLVLWLDSSIVPIGVLNDVWAQIERDGYFLVDGGYGDNYTWTADSAYADLFPGMAIDTARKYNRQIPQIVAGIIGLDVRSKIGSKFLNEYYRLAKDTNAFCGPWANSNCKERPQYGQGSSYTTEPCGPPDVKGHRHDQSAASVIAYFLDMKPTKYPKPYSYNSPGEGTVLLHDGAGVVAFGATQAPEPDEVQETVLGCPECKSQSVGMAGGMRRCNQCGAQFI